MNVFVKGHTGHTGNDVLVVDGRREGNLGLPGGFSKDAKAIAEFLRENLPVGTLDRLSARLCSNALDNLINSDRLDERADTNEFRDALKGWIKELDAEAK